MSYAEEYARRRLLEEDAVNERTEREFQEWKNTPRKKSWDDWFIQGRRYHISMAVMAAFTITIVVIAFWAQINNYWIS